MVNLREWALPVYTIMMQMAVGGMLILWVIYAQAARRGQAALATRISQDAVIVIFVTAAAAVVGSHFHLSRPLLSYLAFNNLGTSWLSREVLFTVLFVLLVGLLWLLQRYAVGSPKLRLATGWAAVLMGLATVYSMSQVYLLPPQVAWNSLTTPVAFFAATILLGGLAVSALLLMNLYLLMLREQATVEVEGRVAVIRPAMRAIALVIVATVITELVNYVVQITMLAQGASSARASVDLLLGLYGVLFAIRLALLGFGAAGSVAANLWQPKSGKPLTRMLIPVYLAFLLILVSEVLGRFLFYAIHVRTGI